MIRKRGQAWGLDATVAAMIFITSVVVFYLYVINYKTSEGNEIEMTRFEAEIVASSFFSEGTPLDWDENTVSRLGVLSGGKIDELKMARFYNLTLEDYERTKRLFGTRYDYGLTFSEPITIESQAVTEIGQQPTPTAEASFKVTRFTSYKGRPVTVEVVAWK